MGIVQSLFGSRSMADAYHITHVVKGCVKRIAAYHPYRGKGCCNTSAPIVGGGQEDVFFHDVLPIAHTDIIGKFGGYKNALSLAQRPCRFIQDAITTAHNSIKKAKGITVLHDMVVFSHYAKYHIVITAQGAVVIRHFNILPVFYLARCGNVQSRTTGV